MIATPKDIIRRKGNKKDIPQLLDFMNKNDVGGIIIGLPLNLSDQETAITLFVKRFTNELMNYTNLPIIYENEALSSFQAEEFLITEMHTKFTKTKSIVDKVAAAYIMESFFNRNVGN